jgi:branched-chain amino acid transport system permease protein
MQLGQQLINALALTAVYLLIALGITVIYGLTKLVNFAQGQLLVLGSYLAYSLVQGGVPLWLSIVVATIGVAVIGEILDLLLFRRTLNSQLRGFVISLGLIIVIQEASVLIWGTADLSIETPFTTRIFHPAGLALSAPLILMLATAIVLVIVLTLVFGRTKFGRGTKALSEKRATAQLMGVPVGRYISYSFLIGSAIAGLGGAIFGTLYPFDPFSGTPLVLIAFAIAIIGGLGSIKGAIVAALLLAIPQSLATAYISISWAPALSLVAAALIILWRPNGIFNVVGTGSSGHFSMGDFAARLHAGEIRIAAAIEAARTRSGRRRIPGLSVDRLAIWIAIVLTGLAPVILPSAEALSIASYMVIVATAAAAFWLTFRQAGIFSVAPAALMGVGGYTAGYLLTRFNLNFWLQLPAAIVAAGLVALVIGLIALRTSESYFVILTLMLAELLVLLFTNLTSITAGSLGITVSTPPSNLGPISFEGANAFYYLAFAIFVVTMLVIYGVTRTAFGRRLVSIRENEQLARSLGVNVLKDKVIVFTIFGAISGAAGVMLMYYLRYITPTTYDVPLALNITLVVLMGGATVWLGPLVGAAIFAFLPSWLNLSPDAAQVAYGVVLIAVILFMPTGIVGKAKELYMLAWFRVHPALSKTGSPKSQPSNGVETPNVAFSSQSEPISKKAAEKI